MTQLLFYVILYSNYCGVHYFVTHHRRITGICILSYQRVVLSVVHLKNNTLPRMYGIKKFDSENEL